jgi:hypothetical protein
MINVPLMGKKRVVIVEVTNIHEVPGFGTM